MSNRFNRWFEQKFLPNYEDYYGTFHAHNKWQNRSVLSKTWYWLYNFPGFRFKIGNIQVTFLELFEGHPWDRVYINTPNWHICICPLSKIQKWTSKKGWGRESTRFLLVPSDVDIIEAAMRKAGHRNVVRQED